MAEPYIKLFKKLLKWEWYDDTNTVRLFIHCLLRANWEDGSWHGIHYEAGQFITSLETLAKETHLSIKQVRTALDHLKRTNEVADLRQGNHRIITVIKWNEYQSKGRPAGSATADHGQTMGKPWATDKDYIDVEECTTNITCSTKNKKYAQSFETFWKSYPRHNDKARAYENYLARLNAGYSEDELLTACKNYAEECRRNNTEEKYIKHGATFLSVHEPFRDYLKKGEETNEQSNIGTAGRDSERDKEIDEIIKRIDDGDDGILF